MKEDVEVREESKGRRILSLLFEGKIYRFLAVSLALNLLLVEWLVLASSTTPSQLVAMAEPVYVWITVALAILLPAMFGLALTQVMYLRAQGDWLRGLGRTLAGAAFAGISVGCPVCGSPALSLVGVEGGLAAFPLQGLELKALALFLVGSALWANSKRIVEGGISAAPGDEDQVGVSWPRRRLLGLRALPALLVLGSLAAFYLLPLFPPSLKVSFADEAATSATGQAAISLGELLSQINPQGGYAMPAVYGDIGPRLIEAGAIDLEQFLAVYERAGQPLTEEQIAILSQGSQETIVIDEQNAYFLLNLFWALGLTNDNDILEEGPMMMYGEEGVGGFASTGGWTIGRLQPAELFSSEAIVVLTSEQQASVQAVAEQVFRPCCNNHTAFPDCNHGMAMLGLLQLMAAQGASEAQMFESAKYVNAYWFPQQALEVAVFLKAVEGLDFSAVDGEVAVGADLFSGSGFGQVHAWLAENGLLGQAPRSGGGCGV